MKESDPIFITFRFDRLELLLQKFIKHAKDSKEWVSPLGVVLSLLLTFLVSDFRDRFGLKSSQWELLVIIAIIISCVWFLYTLIRAIKSLTFDVLLDELRSHSQSREIFRGLFFLKAPSKKDGFKILTYRDVGTNWDCYLLLHYHFDHSQTQEEQMDEFVAFASNSLGLRKDQIILHHLENVDLDTRKYSEFGRQETTYHMKFFSIHTDKNANIQKLKKPQFQIGGRTFYWLTLDELERYPNTAKRNGDLIRHLRDHFDIFFNHLADFTTQIRSR